MPDSCYTNGIDSPHYRRQPAFKPDVVRQMSAEIVKQGIPNNSMLQLVPVSFSSYPYGKSSPTIIGDYAFMKSGGGRLEAFHVSDIEKYGLATHWEEKGDRFQSWKDLAEKNQGIEYVKYPQKSIIYGLMESFEERQLKLDEGSTPVRLFVHDIAYNGPINRFGKFSHQVRNLKQHLIDYYGMKSTQELVSFLKSRGLTLKEIDYLAAGFIPEGFVYAVKKINGKRVLLASEDAYEGNARAARELGLNPKDMIAFNIDEEQIHLARDKDISTLAGVIAEELATKSIATDFYIKMARESQGNPALLRKYAILAALKDEDIRTTVKNYVKIHLKHRRDLEEAVEESEEMHAGTGEYSAQTGLAGKVISISKYQSQSKGTKGREAKEGQEKGKVYDGKNRFQRSKYNEGEGKGKYVKTDARGSEADNPEAEAKEPGKPEGESGDSGKSGEPADAGDATAEAA